MTKTIHFYAEIHTHKTRWWWLCVWQGPFREAEMNFTFFWKSLAFCLSNCECEQWQTWAAVRYLHLLCILSFPHSHKSSRWPYQPYHPLDLCGSVGRDSPIMVTVAPLRALQWIYGSLGSDSDTSLFGAQDRCSLTGQSMAQQSFGAFGPIKVWDLSGASEREIETERQREVLRDSKCTFLLQCHQEKRMRE